MSALDAGLNRQATKLYQAGHFREAEQLFRRLMGQDRKNWQVPLMLGLCRRAQGDLEQAIRWVSKSVELGDGQPATHYYLGRLMTDSGQAGPAREQFAQAIALDPNHVEARTGMGMVSLMRGDFERAKSELKTALRADNKHRPALTALARTLLELDEVEEAYQHAARAVKLEPDDPVAQTVVGRVLFRQGQLDLAERCFRAALESGMDAGDVHAMLARVLAVRGRDADALTHWSKMLELGHGDASAVIEVSHSLERVGDIAQARKLLRRAMTRWPDEAQLGLRLAELALLDGQPGAAAEVLNALDQSNPEVVVMQARAADAIGETERAASLLEPVVAADEDCEQHTARLQLSRMRSKLAPSDLDAARVPLAPLLERKHPLGDATVAWSMACEAAGEFDRAAEALEDLLAAGVANDNDRRILHNRLGNCYRAADKRALAWANWQKGAWRGAPNLSRLEAQRQSGMLDRWLAYEGSPFEPMAFDDNRPEPVIVAGWPGSAREILLAALLAHPEVSTLDRDGENRRLDAIDAPADPERLLGASREELMLGRKRFLRGAPRDRGDAAVLEAGWWPASMIPALARRFPGLTVLFPVADPQDLALQWRIDGYADVDALLDDYRRELALWEKMRDLLGLHVVEFSRDELLDTPGEAATRAAEALGLADDADARAAAERLRGQHRFVVAGEGARYAAVAESTPDASPDKENES